MKLSELSISKKLALIILLATSLSLFSTALIFSFSAMLRAYQDTKENMQTLAQVIGHNSQAALVFEDSRAASTTLSALQAKSEISGAWLMDAHGHSLASYTRNNQDRRNPSANLSQKIVETLLPSTILLDEPVMLDNALIGSVILEVTITPVWMQILKNLAASGLLALAGMSMAAILGMRLGASIVRSIMDLLQVTGLVTRKKDYSVRVPQAGQDEIGALVNNFNMMLSELYFRDEQLRRHQEELEEQVRNRTAELHQAMREAEAGTQAKSLFLANMSHEIRTPLNAIIGMAEVSLETPKDELRRDALETILHETLALLEIINEILDFSKIEADQIQLEQREFSIQNVLRHIDTSIAIQANRKGVVYASEMDPDVPNRIYGDPLRLRQILFNLIGNALKFTKKGEIRVQVELIGKNDQLATIRFSVTDTGIGIANDRLGIIFDSFSQADSSTTRKYGGTGLGLSISKRLVELMGGEIGVTSHVGSGSTFWFVVPFATVAETAPSTVEEITAFPDLPTGPALLTPHNIKILLVEDYPTNQQVALRHLRGAGFFVDVAENGLQAVEAVSREDYNLILMDIQMPEMDGYAATQEIRKLEEKNKDSTRNTRIPIIAMTAHALTGYKDKCLAAGMDDYLTKPMRRHELLAMVQKWTGVAIGSSPRAVREGVEQESVTQAPLDYALALEEFEQDASFLQEMIQIFIANAQRQMKSIEKSLQSGDIEAVVDEAHAMKGGAANLTAVKIAALAQDLEQFAHAGSFSECHEILLKLRANLHELQEFTRRLS
ncbi:hybrid sensor histidine kinase/response regulator [Desulfonatronum thioautotrophicum]|uniref:hybrid sensor histidine kinase/response regulator n=1 Tax=Desulfonatronum thioautotrophicum TaxID=617001 RepID=UPI0005EB0C63|nr:hybrid sensor histidine kinase/response regulator [Desulfonatronum thioautotrophicum]